MPTNKKSLPGLTDFQDKFLMFQECVVSWMFELSEDLSVLGTPEKKISDGRKVIRFPGNSKVRRQGKREPA